MTITDLGTFLIQDKLKIIKVYARVLPNPTISGIVFIHSWGGRTMLIGDNPLAATDPSINPLIILDDPCDAAGKEKWKIDACKYLKTSGAVQSVDMPDGFDRLEWGYDGPPNKEGFKMTDLNFYKNDVLLGTITTGKRGYNRKNLSLPEGYIANGINFHVWTWANLYPHNYLQAIFGMKDPNPPKSFGDILDAEAIRYTPIHGGWSDWNEWGICSESCGSGIKKRTRTCSNPLPSNGGVNCVGDNFEEAQCNNANCPRDGGWRDLGDWGECIKNSEGVGTQTKKRVCDDPLPAFGGAPCSGAELQLKNCVMSHNSSGAPPESQRITIGPSGAVQAPTVGQPSVVSSDNIKNLNANDGSNIMLYIIIALIVVAFGFGFYKYKMQQHLKSLKPAVGGAQESLLNYTAP